MNETSLKAYRDMEDSGCLHNYHLWYYEAICHHGPITANEAHKKVLEIHTFPEDYRHNAHARVDDLVKKKVIEKCGKKICSVTGRQVSLWQITGVLPVKRKTLRDVGCKTMDEYYETAYWVSFRANYFARHNPVQCFLTGSIHKIQLHHLHYDTLGDESDADVVPLSEAAHDFVEHIIKTYGVKRNVAHLIAKGARSLA